MTLIVPFVSDGFVALASDRRITWKIGGATTSRWEDNENKAIVLAGHFLMGYAGFARLGAEMPTDRWVVEQLVGVADPSSYFHALADAAESTVEELGLPLERSGHVFVAVGYGRSRSDPANLHAFGVTVSNAVGDYGTWEPRKDFSVTRTPAIETPEAFWISAYGTVPAESVIQRTVDLIEKYREENPGKRLGVLQHIVDLVRHVATIDDDVSQSLSLSVLPKQAVPALEVSLPLRGLRDPVDELTCVYLPENLDAEQAVVYGPATVSPTFATQGHEIWTSKPPWWND